MKKVTLWHLSKKHKLPISELRALFVSKWLMAENARKVFKKPAKKAIAAYQSTQVSESSFSWLGWFAKSAWGYLALWLIGLIWMFGILSSYSSSVASEWELNRAEQFIEKMGELQDDVDHSSAAEPILPKTWADISTLWL